MLRVRASIDRRGPQEVEGAAIGGDEASVWSDLVGSYGVPPGDGTGGGHRGSPLGVHRGARMYRICSDELHISL